MAIDLPLISPVYVQIYRLDITATWAQNPPGGETQGFDPVLREPILYDDPVTGARTSPRQELSPVLVPCQIETRTFDELRETFGGDNPASTVVFVTRRKDLETLGLIDATTRNCTLKKSDRISRLESYNYPGTVIQTFDKPLYVYEILPGSYGFGSEGHSLEIIYSTHRSADPYGK